MSPAMLQTTVQPRIRKPAKAARYTRSGRYDNDESFLVADLPNPRIL